ncbi:MAG: hypothetical protein ACQERO_05755 [Bacteroidota bacterium]
MNSDFLIFKLNALEFWLESSKNSLLKLSVRIDGYLLLTMFMMISNVIALFHWPFTAMRRL